MCNLWHIQGNKSLPSLQNECRSRKVTPCRCQQSVGGHIASVSRLTGSLAADNSALQCTPTEDEVGGCLTRTDLLLQDAGESPLLRLATLKLSSVSRSFGSVCRFSPGRDGPLLLYFLVSFALATHPGHLLGRPAPLSRFFLHLPQAYLDARTLQVHAQISTRACASFTLLILSP